MLIIDDDYPTLESLLASPIGDNLEVNGAQTKAGAYQNVLKLVKGFRKQKPPLIVDIHDGQNLALEPELEVVDHLHQSDLLVLDFSLDKAKPGDGSKAIGILRHLAVSPHFNLVMMHSSLEIDEVYQRVVIGLLQPEMDFTINDEKTGAAKAVVDALDPELYDNLTDLLLEDDAAYLAIRGDVNVLKHRPSLRNFPFTKFDTACNEKAVVEDIRPALIASIIKTRHDKLKAGMQPSQHLEEISFSKPTAAQKWVKLGTLFVGFTRKADNVNLIDDLVRALNEWHPQPSRLMLKKLSVELNEWGATAETSALGTKFASAKWYHDTLSADKHEQSARLSEILSRHTENYIGAVEPNVIRFASSLLSLDSEVQPIAAARAHYKVDLSKSADHERAVLENNLLVSSIPVREGQLQIGHVFKLAEDYWICLSPACDLVPAQQKEVRTAIFGEGVLPFLAVRLNETTTKFAKSKANDKRFVYLNIAGQPQVYCINQPESAGSSLDWHTFFAIELGKITLVGEDRAARLQVAQTKVVEGVLSIVKIEATVVGQLRYAYALNLSQELGRSLTRIGLDYLAVPKQ